MVVRLDLHTKDCVLIAARSGVQKYSVYTVVQLYVHVHVLCELVCITTIT